MQVRTHKKAHVLILMLISFSLIFVGCKTERFRISYNDVVFDTVNSDLIVENKTYTNVLKDYGTAEKVLADLGASSSIIKAYDEEYLKSKDLLVLAFASDLSCKYTIDDLLLEGKNLTVELSEHMLGEVIDPVSTCRLILIDIWDGNLNPMNMRRLEMKDGLYFTDLI